VNGSALVIAAIVVQAVTNGVLSGHLDGSESLLLSFTAFGLSALASGIVDRRRRTRGIREPLRGERLRVMVLLNAATAVAFLGFYTALTLAPAALAAALETGIGPLVLALSALRHPEARDLRRILLGAVTLALALGAALRAAAAGAAYSAADLTAGLALAAVAGTAAAGIAVLSHRLGRLDVSPVTVTAHRFHLTYLLALGLLLFNPSTGLRSITGTSAGVIVLLAVLGVALPLFVLQIGMQRTPPIVVTLLASGVPGMTYLTAVCARGEAFGPLAFILINGSLVLAFLGPPLIRPQVRAAALIPSLQESWNASTDAHVQVGARRPMPAALMSVPGGVEDLWASAGRMLRRLVALSACWRPAYVTHPVVQQLRDGIELREEQLAAEAGDLSAPSRGRG
jgi:drug/metabolite transporter (DMT)-like permease